MPDTTLDEPKALARAVALDMADDHSEVGDFVTSQALEDGVTDFRFEAHIPGYEGWQWSVTLYHDAELDHWTVNESSLLPTEQALLPPKWIPWKDRLLPTDLSVTDSIGTDPDDPRLEEGLDESQLQAVVDAVEAQDRAAEQSSHSEEGEGDEPNAESEPADGADKTDQTEQPDRAEESDGSDAPTNDASSDGVAANDAQSADSAQSEPSAAQSSALDVAEAIDEFELSRRHVLSPLGRAQAAKRWYDGPHGPKALSTKTAGGSTCESCGFFIPLQGDLNRMFGVCANKWSPDDGRVVSLDHGCGEHSEIDPPQPSRLWVQSKPAFDDLHIDIVAQRPRDEHAEVELLERMGVGNRLSGEDDDASDEESGIDGLENADGIADESASAGEGPADTDEESRFASDESDVDESAVDDDDVPVDAGEAEEVADDETGDESDEDDADDVATEADIEAQTVPDDDATDEDIAEHAADPDDDVDDEASEDGPEVVATVDLSGEDPESDDSDDDGSDDADDESEDADDDESDEA
ncbi:DUF3027 domain-containing protein [Bifidobacterium vespertilionis]|uniref:DUF3027 domain-containing protein n=1 Tax=Bifidobacterium vespertilionis TaxID=2562524 RepID=UPI001BDBDCCA|nr:DUF3027 domain-containing protein [Bifidobacterium vespertilionis]MBT1178650.1 DUF3027 domain-containing protein [Bifidobacterium vespertilionis]